MRMVDRVHGDAANRRTMAEPAIATGLADVDVLLVGVGDGADGRAAVPVVSLAAESHPALTGAVGVVRKLRFHVENARSAARQAC